MAPTGSEMGWINSSIKLELGVWNKQKKLGFVFDSSTGFTLPNTAVRSADAAFILKDRWEAVPKIERKRFATICPDFVIEILSDNDNRHHLQNKMKEWIENGCRLAWLIDPELKATSVYKSNSETIAVPFDLDLNGENVLPGFTLRVQDILSIK